MISRSMIILMMKILILKWHNSSELNSFSMKKNLNLLNRMEMKRW